MKFEKKYLFTTWNEWNHIIYESAEDFQVEFGYSPNILLANSFTLSQIDFIANINPEIGKDVSRVDELTGAQEYVWGKVEGFGISSFTSDHHDIEFYLDQDLLDKVFVLIFDDDPEDDGEDDVNPVPENVIELERVKSI
jgi:hypothetical protein